MLDELSLRTRRRLQRCLQRSGALALKSENSANLSEYRLCGLGLQRDLLASLLGEEDYGYLISEVAYGVGDFQLRSDLPLILWFGYSMGTGLHAHLGAAVARRGKVAILCALFNFGIVIFDRICDNARGGVGRLSECFDATTIQGLADNPAAGLPALQAAAATGTPETRILLKLVCAFYATAWQTAEESGDSQGWKRLNEMLMRAYYAELTSVMTPSSQDLGSAEAKSTLPFQIMLQIALLGDSAIPSGARASSYALTKDIGMVFLLIDDLTDLRRDLQSKDANSLLCDARRHQNVREPPDEDALLVHILAGPYIDNAAEHLQTSLVRIIRTLRDSVGEGVALENFLEVILTYVIGWCS